MQKDNFRPARCRRPIIALIVFITAILTLDAAAQKVYKWVDDDGNTHYGDAAPAGHSEEIRLRKTPTVEASVNTRRDRTERLLKAFQQDRADKAEGRQAAAETQKKRKANCATAKDTHYSYVRSGTIYTLDEQGNRVFLNDNEYANALAQAQKAIDKWCK